MPICRVCVSLIRGKAARIRRLAPEAAALSPLKCSVELVFLLAPPAGQLLLTLTVGPLRTSFLHFLVARGVAVGGCHWVMYMGCDRNVTSTHLQTCSPRRHLSGR